MNDDAQLLRRYVDDRAEDAFAELVRRHVALVYSCALRSVGHDAHLAEDVTQKVFTALARKASMLTDRPTLAGWLYIGARQAAAEVVRGERRRKNREEQSMTMEHILHSDDPNAQIDWDRLRPVLDDLVAELKDVDRDAVVMRFFEKKSFTDIGAALSQTEDGARKRVERAVEKLRERLAEKGVTSGTAALAFALAEQAGAAVPATLAAQVAGTALAQTVAAGAGAGLLATLWSAVTSQVAAVGSALLVGASAVAWQYQAKAALEEKVAALPVVTPADLESLAHRNHQLARRVAEADDLRHGPVAVPLAEQVAPPASDSRPQVAVNVTISMRGTISWDGQPITLDDYLARLQALSARPDERVQILIRSPGWEQSGALSYVLEQASKAKIADLKLESQSRPNVSDDWITASPPAPPDRHQLKPPEIADPVEPTKP